jgi:hypothetical protein
VTPEAFKAALTDLGLRQIDLARLLAHFAGGEPNPVKVNRWAGGGAAHRAPDGIVALLGVLALLSTRARHQLYREAGIKIRD